MGARNKVISGAFEGREVTLSWKGKGIVIKEKTLGNQYLNKNNVKQYEVIDSNNNKSAAGAVARGALGMAFLGPIGLLAAAGGQGTHVVAVEFKNGLKSLIEINDVLYKEFVAAMF